MNAIDAAITALTAIKIERALVLSWIERSQNLISQVQDKFENGSEDWQKLNRAYGMLYDSVENLKDEFRVGN